MKGTRLGCASHQRVKAIVHEAASTQVRTQDGFCEFFKRLSPQARRVVEELRDYVTRIRVAFLLHLELPHFARLLRTEVEAVPEARREDHVILGVVVVEDERVADRGANDRRASDVARLRRPSAAERHGRTIAAACR